MSSFGQILARYREEALSQRDKGDRFERLMLRFLRTAPEYQGLFSHVWLWADFPHKASFSPKDTGIDIVCRTQDGDFWAVQCKCYLETTQIDKKVVDSFLATSGKQIVLGDGTQVRFKHRLFLSTTNNWGSEAERTIENQDPPVTRYNLSDFEASPVDWDALENGLAGNEARKERKAPRPHQQEAMEAVHDHFRTHDRGKLIMACGTGKTFTALKIAETQAGAGGLVLFLAPSIALVGQTLREWMAESTTPIYPICVCSDPKVSQTRVKNDEDELESVIDLALPATTDERLIGHWVDQGKKKHPDHMLVVFSTYQSIEAVSRAQNLFGRDFDLVVCDEAHRTTGVTLANEDETAFVRVHDNGFIKAKKRLYMTATPRLYADTAKKKASDAGAALCSMDDVALYGEEIYRLGFGAAVDKGLLADYKVLVLTVSDAEYGEALQHAIADKEQDISMEDAAKLVGCVNALSKRMLIDEGLLKGPDPAPMRKAVAFCQTIKVSKHISGVFNDFKDKFYQDMSEAEREEVVDVAAKHVDGTMSAPRRDELLAWLKSSPAEGNECRILTNVRCLSEGVDVPSLDAVLFLSAKNSQIDVVQSVGRVMRTAPGKKFGYIIIPVLVPSDMKPEDALNDNKRFQVVWTVLNALRAHDDRFEAIINKLDVNGTTGGKILVGSVIGNGENGEGDGDGSGQGGDGTGTRRGQAFQIPLPLQELQNAVYARMVLKVGNRRYLQQWAEDVAKIAQLYISRINKLVEQEGPHKTAFEQMLEDLRRNINPSVDKDELIEMLAQHMITKPVFEALFEDQAFVSHNPVSKALQGMVELLDAQAFEKDTVVLTRFYESIKYRVEGIRSAHERQKVIVELYDNFFRTAFPLTVERLGIVYTPVEIVDFINQSVADLLRATFGRSLSDENVHVLDPFTGTGTFIARMLETGLIDQDALKRKYNHELHANEIVLLAYYIASINIENVYHAVRGFQGPYEPFPGICLTDTFQLGEGGDLSRKFPQLAENSERAEAQRKTPIQVIIGNPPYSVGQKSANDNAQNQSYPQLEAKIARTYAERTDAINKNALYDSYIKAFRWASDRIDKQNGGIIAFVSNSYWLDGNAMNGMRKCLEEEFSALYVFNLRGNQRTSGELSRREGGKIFGSGSRTPIAITVLLKNPAHEGKALIQYYDIGDYLTREQKLDIISRKHSVLKKDFDWVRLTPDEHGDWLNLRNEMYDSFVLLGDKDNKTNRNTYFAPVYSRGLATCRDAWCWNYSRTSLVANIKRTIDYFNRKVESHSDEIDPSCISWSRAFESDYKKGRKKAFSESVITSGLYRPFNRALIYFSASLNEMLYQTHKLFPTPAHKNIAICVPGAGGRWLDFTPYIVASLPDLHVHSDGVQCFPLYFYEQRTGKAPQLPGVSRGDAEYERKDAVTDFALKECRERYGQSVTKEDIFYFVYGFLHSPDYRTTFANDLKKSLPRIPFLDRAEDFRAFSKAGRELADLHLNYEDQPAHPDVKIQMRGADGLDEAGLYRVVKMRFPDKADKSVIRYNDYITLSNIPLDAYDYVVNGRSAIDWIMERYQVRTDAASGIVNDPNDWSAEHEKPRYILDLLLSVVTVSVRTNEIVESLPRLSFDEARSREGDA